VCVPSKDAYDGFSTTDAIQPDREIRQRAVSSALTVERGRLRGFPCGMTKYTKKFEIEPVPKMFVGSRQIQPGLFAQLIIISHSNPKNKPKCSGFDNQNRNGICCITVNVVISYDQCDRTNVVRLSCDVTHRLTRSYQIVLDSFLD
jgi:hypothetical protein